MTARIEIRDGSKVNFGSEEETEGFMEVSRAISLRFEATDVCVVTRVWNDDVPHDLAKREWRYFVWAGSVTPAHGNALRQQAIVAVGGEEAFAALRLRRALEGEEGEEVVEEVYWCIDVLRLMKSRWESFNAVGIDEMREMMKADSFGVVWDMEEGDYVPFSC